MRELGLGDTIRGIVKMYGDKILMERRLWGAIADCHRFGYDHELEREVKECIEKGYASEIYALRYRKEKTADLIEEIIRQEYQHRPDRDAAVSALLAFAYGAGTFDEEDMVKFHTDHTLPSPGNPSSGKPSGARNSGRHQAGNKPFRIFCIIVASIMGIFAIWLLKERKPGQLSTPEKYMQRLVSYARADSIKETNARIASARADSTVHLSIAGISIGTPFDAAVDSLKSISKYPEAVKPKSFYVFEVNSIDSLPFDVLNGRVSLIERLGRNPNSFAGPSFEGLVVDDHVYPLTIYEHEDRVAIMVAKDTHGFMRFEELVDSMVSRYGHPEVYESAPRVAEDGSNMPAEVNMRWHFANGEIMLTPREIVMISSEFIEEVVWRLYGKKDVAKLTLLERNSYLRNTRKHTTKDFWARGLRVGEHHLVAESYMRKAEGIKLISVSHNGDDISCWLDFNGKDMHTRLFINNQDKVYAICMEIYGKTDLDNMLRYLVKKYGHPEILPATSYKDHVLPFNVINPEFNPYVKEYSWHFKNGCIILGKDYLVFTTADYEGKARGHINER